MRDNLSQSANKSGQKVNRAKIFLVKHLIARNNLVLRAFFRIWPWRQMTFKLRVFDRQDMRHLSSSLALPLCRTGMSPWLHSAACIGSMRRAVLYGKCTPPGTGRAQNRIVDLRFAAQDYRTTQNYVGESIGLGRERVHFICPKPDDLPDMMAGLIAAHHRMGQDSIHPVIHAAAIAYGFVFLHPFEDGNGRIHRFLIHNILSRRDYTPEGLMFPVSAAMLRHPPIYDASLEAFSRPLIPLVEYSLDEMGRMMVHNDTAIWYRFIDMTSQAEALFGFIDQTIKTELAEELTFLVNYDRTKAAIQATIDLPDRQIDLFIRLCLENHGRLSANKRSSHFAFLTSEEIAKMEQAVQSVSWPSEL